MRPAELNAMPVDTSTTSSDAKESGVTRKSIIQRAALLIVALLALGALALSSYEPSKELGSLRGSVMDMCRWYDAGTLIVLDNKLFATL